MNGRRLAGRSVSRRTANGQLALLLFAAALTGCKSDQFTYYISPRVTGRVLAANTHQPLADVKVRRVVPPPNTDTDGTRRGSQFMEQTTAARTDADGKFVLDSEKDLALFRHTGWYSVTVSFERTGYTLFETNYTVANVSGYSSQGAPLVNTGDILLKPKSQ